MAGRPRLIPDSRFEIRDSDFSISNFEFRISNSAQLHFPLCLFMQLAGIGKTEIVIVTQDYMIQHPDSQYPS